MKRIDLFFLLVMFTGLSFELFAQTEKAQPVYVIVHGAWGGGWAFKEVDSLLTAKGCLVYRPTLTGQGERAHLASPEIRLETHILDVVNLILYEELHHVILVGHSYGGMVITGVADSLPGRIDQMIYLDAFVPEDGESLNAIEIKNGEEPHPSENGFVIPHWVPDGQQPPKDVPQSFKTFDDPIALDNPQREAIHTTFILTVEPGGDPEGDDFAWAARRAEQKGWRTKQLASGHNAQWDAPQALAEMLFTEGTRQP